MCRDAVVLGGLFLGLIKYSFIIDGMEELDWRSIVLWVAGGQYPILACGGLVIGGGGLIEAADTVGGRPRGKNIDQT